MQSIGYIEIRGKEYVVLYRYAKEWVSMKITKNKIIDKQKMYCMTDEAWYLKEPEAQKLVDRFLQGAVIRL